MASERHLDTNVGKLKQEFVEALEAPVIFNEHTNFSFVTHPDRFFMAVMHYSLSQAVCLSDLFESYRRNPPGRFSKGEYMYAADATIQALQEEVSELKIRVKELGEENQDLREICNKNGIQYEDNLAARRHRRLFDQLVVDHPIGRTATASDALGVDLIVRGIAECAGSVLRTGMIARCFFAAFTKLTTQFPWKFGFRRVATLDEAHEGKVNCLAVLDGGRLASGSRDRTVKIWELATEHTGGRTLSLIHI